MSPDMGNVQSITIERIKSATSEDECIQKLIKYISCGFPSANDELPPDAQPFWNVRNELTNVRDLVLYGTRIVVPSSLRSEILEVLHSAHQGVTGMKARARWCVYWPGLLLRIEDRNVEIVMGWHRRTLGNHYS